MCWVAFVFNATATNEIYTLSLHDALPISSLEGEEDSVIDSTGLEVEIDRGTLTKRGYRKKVEPREGKDMTDYELTKRGHRKKTKPRKDNDNDKTNVESKKDSGLTRRGYRNLKPKEKIKKVKTRRGYR